MKWSQLWRDEEGRYWIDVRQQKPGEPLSIPCHEVLRAELETMPRIAETILVGERGAPLTGSSLSVMVRKALRDRARTRRSN
jgi:hypothetical protein